MNHSREMAATIVGAVIGGVAGYLFFTERGRSVRRQIEPALEDFSRELMSFRNTVQKAAGVANEGWNLLSEGLGEGGKPPAQAPATARATGAKGAGMAGFARESTTEALPSSSAPQGVVRIQVEEPTLRRDGIPVVEFCRDRRHRVRKADGAAHVLPAPQGRGSGSWAA